MTTHAAGRDDPDLPQALVRDQTAEHHHEVVMPVRDVTRPARTNFPGPPGADTAWRLVFPITYDIVLDQPEQTLSGEDA